MSYSEEITRQSDDARYFLPFTVLKGSMIDGVKLTETLGSNMAANDSIVQMQIADHKKKIMSIASSSF